ncbi:MAG: polysaccharide biosynthesis/export family protein [Deltaproteobacteria bacterium]|nr:polysaccharide biosynthesis/export family protein [Deltaproteobacteria bacterium]
MKKASKIVFFIILFVSATVRFERNGAIEHFERFHRLGLVDLTNLMNLFNQPSAWSQESRQQPASSAVKLPRNYVIGQGDVLEVFVWRNEKLSRQVVVRPDGKISLPLIQDVRAEGLTVPWLRNEITRRFSKYLEHPKVTVIVNKINSYKVSVLGRVARPGVYPITGDTTLVEAISMAGGFTEWANKRKITVITHRNGKKEKLVINYKKIVSGKDPSQNIVLKRHDTIIVP